MKIVSFKNALFTCICLLELMSHINAKHELDKVQDVFSKQLLKEIGLHFLKSKQNNTACIRDINLWYNSLTKQKSLWAFQSKTFKCLIFQISNFFQLSNLTKSARFLGENSYWHYQGELSFFWAV